MQISRIPLDDTDRRLLDAVGRDGALTADRLGQALNLSASQAGRRRQRLEAEGAIESYRAHLSPVALGLDVQAFVTVEMATHDPETVKGFTRIVATRPEIVGAWTLTGEADYLLRVYLPDLAALNALVHETLLPHPAVARVRSQIVMDHLKRDAPLPVF